PDGSGPAGAPPNRPVTLSYLNWFGPADPQNVLFPYALERFRERSPQLTVEQVVTSGSVMEKFLALAAAGTAPDVAALNPQFVEPLRARGALADLTPYVKRDARSFQPEDFNEATLLRATRGGRWHAIPLQMGLWFLLYHKGAFQGAGAGTPDASWNWDRLAEAVRAVMGRDPSSLGMTMPPYELPVRSNGGEILSPDEKRCLLDQPGAVTGVQWNGDLRQKHRLVAAPEDTAGQTPRQLFDSGRLAVHVADPGFLSQTQRGKLSFPWDIATVPQGRSGRVSTVKGPSLVLAAGGKEADTAWAWLGHYTGPEMQRYVAVEGKVVSARKTALKAYVELDEGFNKGALTDVAAVARPLPYVARYDEIAREIDAGLEAVYSGARAPREAMGDVVRKVDPLLATP
ncbi:MAG TPA: extracellular solute-binding protein, partial [Chloroflexota bacterium]|nr:extracellular solute-binding protein [Chloroflexota bacterium]